jgi:hypothetical protein
VYLDLAWHARHDPPFRDDELRVASALEDGARNAENWGKRQDFISLEPGFYLFDIEIWAEGYDTFVKRIYRLHWPGAGQEDDIRLVEVAGSYSARGPRQPTSTPLVPTDIQHRYALLIGVRDFVSPEYRSLPHTVHDVIRLEQVLSSLGYTVRTLHSAQANPQLKPTRENIWGELENLSGQTGPGDLLLVHFGGHGDLDDKNVAYLVPANGRKSSLGRTAIDLDEFKRVLSSAGAQAKILLLDACHSGSGRAADGMNAEFERHVFLEADGTATLAACRHGQVACEHNEAQHGVFTYFVLQGLQGRAPHRDPQFITFADLNNYVTYAVKDWAIQHGREQWPNAVTQLSGDPPLVELKSVQ